MPARRDAPRAPLHPPACPECVPPGLPVAEGLRDPAPGQRSPGALHPFRGKVGTKSFLVENPNSAILFLHMLCLNINTN